MHQIQNFPTGGAYSAPPDPLFNCYVAKSVLKSDHYAVYVNCTIVLRILVRSVQLLHQRSRLSALNVLEQMLLDLLASSTIIIGMDSCWVGLLMAARCL